MSWILAFAGFAALVILHELGHFAVAKLVGMRVERFALFFPPLLAKVRRGETEYGIGAIPLGGYVKITGMSPREEIPEDVLPRAYFNQPVWKRVAVILAGPVMNVLVAFAILFSLFAFKGPAASTDRVDAIEHGSPAAAALRPGDRVVAVDGVRGDQAAFIALIAKHHCAGAQTDGCRATPARVRVVRGGRTQTIAIRPRYDASMKRARLGFSYGVVNTPESVPTAAGDSVTAMWSVTKTSVSTFGRLFTSSQARKQVSGPVGSYETTRQTIKQLGFVDALNILAIISLSLAIVNLFPFLPLDGGHVFWAVAEKLRGRRIPFFVVERASVIGVVLIAFLFIVGLSNDVGRLTGSGFPVR